MSNTSSSKPTVSRYSFQLRGRHVRWATEVAFPDGKIVRFVETMPKRQAIVQATELVGRGADS